MPERTLFLFLLLFFLPFNSNPALKTIPKVGMLAGSMVFVDVHEKKWLGDAANVTVELDFRGQTIPLVSNNLGDYMVELRAGRYELLSVHNAEGKKLQFSPGQHRFFKIESGKTKRFDVMLLER